MAFAFSSKPRYIANTFIVTIDFDDTLAYRQHLKVMFAEKLFGINITLEQGKEDTFPLGAAKYRQMKPYIERAVDQYLPMPNCKDVLMRLYQLSFRFAVVTSRIRKSEHEDDLTPAIKFIRQHQLPIKFFHATNGFPKDYVCNKLHSRAMIDDIYKNLQALHGTHVRAYFLLHPWNAREIPAITDQDIMVVSSWLQFYDEMLHLKELHEAICFFNGWENNMYNVPKIAAFARRADEEKLIGEYKKELLRSSI